MRWMLLAALALGGCNCEGSEISTLRAILEADPAMLDLGQQIVGAGGRGTVNLRSAGELTVNLSQVRLEPPSIFTLVREPRLVLHPGESDLIIVEGVAVQVGDFESEIVISSDAAELRIPIVLHAVAPPLCDDDNPCTTDRFDLDTRTCVFTNADGGACEHPNPCIVDGVCSLGECTGSNDDCEDDNPCTADACEATGCVHTNLDIACDDGAACTTADQCIAGACVGQGVPDGGACDDGDLCTQNDACVAGRCAGVGECPACDPNRTAAIVGGSRTFGFCGSNCQKHLSIETSTGAEGCDAVVLEVCDQGAANCTEHLGFLTRLAHAETRTLAAPLENVGLAPIYGCPDCADGGAATVELVRVQPGPSEHTYPWNDAPLALRSADFLVQGLIDDLTACQTSTRVVVDAACVPR